MTSCFNSLRFARLSVTSGLTISQGLVQLTVHEAVLVFSTNPHHPLTLSLSTNKASQFRCPYVYLSPHRRNLVSQFPTNLQ
jgi:hypothetical protein